MSRMLLRSSVFLVIMGGVCGSGHADDNILGLPAVRATNRQGAVLLHGGGNITNDVFNRFVDLAGGKQARIVLVPSAGYHLSDYRDQQQFTDVLNRRFSSWVRLATSGRITSFAFLHTDNPADADDPSFVQPLIKATGVWFCGGDQSCLNYRYVGEPYPRPTRFQTALREILARGGIVGGTSAGMAALPEIMTLDQHRVQEGGQLSVVAAHGLGLFNGAIVEQHFDERNGRFERFTGLLRDSAKLDSLAGRKGVGKHVLGLAVETSTALVLQGDQVEALGESHAHVFIKAPEGRTITWHTLNSGDKATLKRDPRRAVMLVSGN